MRLIDRLLGKKKKHKSSHTECAVPYKSVIHEDPVQPERPDQEAEDDSENSTEED